PAVSEGAQSGGGASFGGFGGPSRGPPSPVGNWRGAPARPGRLRARGVWGARCRGPPCCWEDALTFTQECVIAVERERLWHFLMELPRVARCVPGVESIEVVDPSAYRGSLKIQVGPIRLALQGTVTVEEQDRRAWRARM